MSLIERQENDKIEIVGSFKLIQVRCANIIEKDGNEVARTFHRHVLTPGDLDENDNLVETDLTQEDIEVQQIANVVWTPEIKELWRQKLISDNQPLTE